MVFLHCVFSNKYSNGLSERMIYASSLAGHWLHSFVFSPLCVLKYLLKLHEILYFSKYFYRTHWALGRGNFKKKSQKVPAFWKMAAVTVIRLLVYMIVPSCIALYCRPRTMGVENIKWHLLTLLPKFWITMVPSDFMTSWLSSGNSYAYRVINQRSFSVSLIVHLYIQGVKTA